jgi:glutamine amidotransferase
MNKVALIDYGLGNLFSVARALTAAKADWFFATKSADLTKADKLVLPGVGAFADGMRGLKEKKLIGAIVTQADKGKPILGVCLGMQLMMSEGHEFGKHQGLGLIAGVVEPMLTDKKLPQIGWNQVRIKTSQEKLFTGIKSDEYFYFVHSYVVRPKNQQVVLGTTDYGGDKFCSVLKYNHIYGTQFHPEKSDQAGLKIYANFVN